MALLHEKSTECIMTELDLYLCPMTQLSIEDKQYTKAFPLPATGITDRGHIELFIPGDCEKHLEQHLAVCTFENYQR